MRGTSLLGAAVLLEVRDLEVRDPSGRVALLRIDHLTVGRGEILGVVGPSGAGKSLLALTLMGLAREQGFSVASGQVLLNGVDLLSCEDKVLDALRGRDLGMVFQDPQMALDPARTCEEQMLEAHRRRPADGPRRSAIETALRDAGLEPDRRLRSAFPVSELSGGERQRLLLAMATQLGPGLLIADEPTTAFDPDLRLQFARFIKARRAAQGMAAIVISHDAAMIAAVADRIVAIESGRLVPAPPPQSAPVADRFDAPPGDWIVRAAGLQRRYRGGGDTVAALKGVNLEVRAGESVGVIGASGAGKTTLARLLVGLTKPDDGVVEVAHGSKGAGFAHMIFQNPAAAFDPRLTVLQSLKDGAAKGTSEHDILALLASLGLTEALVRRRPGQLSGGELQRACVARALAARPRLLVADEPTSALDARSERRVLDVLRAARHAQPRMGMMVITHDLDLLAALCERVVVLEAGRVVETATVADFLADPESEAGRRLTRSWAELAGSISPAA